MAKSGAYQVPIGMQPPSSPFDRRFAAAGKAARRPAAIDAATPTTTAGTGAASGSNACNAVAAIAPADDLSKSSAPPEETNGRAIIAAAGVWISLAVLTLAGYSSMRKKTTHAIVPAPTLYGTAVPATAVPATAVPATAEPAPAVPATTAFATTIPATTVSRGHCPRNLEDAAGGSRRDGCRGKPNAVVVKDWNQTQQDSVIESEPSPGTKVNPGHTVTLHVSAPGGWAYFRKAGRIEVGKTFAITKSMFLYVDEDRRSKQSGSLEAGKSVRVIGVGGSGWAKVVVTD